MQNFTTRLPEPKSNYSRIPNVVFDEIIPTITNLAALKCYLILVRKTWGWGKTGDWLSLSQLMKLGKLSRHSVIDGMRWLDKNGLIWIAKAGIKGKERTMYFLCTIATENLERAYKQGEISGDYLFKTMMKER